MSLWRGPAGAVPYRARLAGQGPRASSAEIRPLFAFFDSPPHFRASQSYLLPPAPSRTTPHNVAGPTFIAPGPDSGGNCPAAAAKIVAAKAVTPTTLKLSRSLYLRGWLPSPPLYGVLF